MAAKQESNQQRLAEIISELTNLARDLGQGRLQVGSHRVRIGAPSSFKLKQKLKDDSISYDISFQLPVVGTEKSAGPDAAGTAEQPAAQPSPPKKSSSSGKPKKELAALWKTVVQKVENNASIPAADSNRLRELAAGLYAGKPWQQAWHECASRIEECLKSAASGDFARARSLAAEVKELTHACHKEYK